MALKTFKPTSPGRRALVLVDRTGLHKGAPEKSLTEGLNKTGGRNNHGRITSRLDILEYGFHGAANFCVFLVPLRLGLATLEICHSHLSFPCRHCGQGTLPPNVHPHSR